MASSMNVEVKLSLRGVTSRRNTGSHIDTPNDETPEETHFKINVFYPMVDSILAGLSVRFQAVTAINEKFRFYGVIFHSRLKILRRQLLALHKSMQWPKRRDWFRNF